MYSVVILFHFCQNVAKLEGILCCKRQKKNNQTSSRTRRVWLQPLLAPFYISARDLYLRKMKIATHYFVLRFEFFSLDSKCIYDKLLKASLT